MLLIAQLAALFDLPGVAVILSGKAAFLVARRTFGKGLLLGLEALIAALGLLVVVRTILGFSIQIEMEGELP